MLMNTATRKAELKNLLSTIINPQTVEWGVKDCVGKETA
jgi:hypothetical protein